MTSVSSKTQFSLYYAVLPLPDVADRGEFTSDHSLQLAIVIYVWFALVVVHFTDGTPLNPQNLSNALNRVGY